MRILAAFMSVIFMFINPVMIVHVRKELEAAFNESKNFEMWVVKTLRWILLECLNVYSTIEASLSYIVFLACSFHTGVTVFGLYGIYSCRPVFFRPLLISCALSTALLLSFVSLNLYLHTNQNADVKTKYEFHMYVGAGFLVVYIVWLVVTWVGYKDVKRLHADFMYWIVEERQSMRRMSLPHQVSIENRSDKSSKSSRTSKHSQRSHHSHRNEDSRPNSVAGSIRSKTSHKSISARTRLSVPL